LMVVSIIFGIPEASPHFGGTGKASVTLLQPMALPGQNMKVILFLKWIPEVGIVNGLVIAGYFGTQLLRNFKCGMEAGVATLVSNKLNPGNHTYQFDGKNMASGIYYYRIQAGEFHQVKKMVLIK